MFIFWDNSNIHISGLKAMEQKEPDQLKELFRTNFKNLFELVRNNREVESAYLSGSIPPFNYLQREEFSRCFLICSNNDYPSYITIQIRL